MTPTNTIDGAVMTDDTIDAVSKALRRAWQLGQTYWQQADSESWSENKRSDETQKKFDALIDEMRAMLAASPAVPAQSEPVAAFNMHPDEAHILASILRGMVEGGSGDPAVIYEDAYSAADEDVYVARAAELLDHYGSAQSAQAGGALYTMDQMREYADKFHLSRMQILVAEKEAYERHAPRPELTDELLVDLFYAASGDISQFRIKARALLTAAQPAEPDTKVKS